MGTEIGIVVVASVVLQMAVVVLGWRLIRITGRQLAWICICIALVMMAFRRISVLHSLMTGGSFGPYDLAEELMALGATTLMLVGVLAIGGLFQSIRRAKDALEAEVTERRRVQQTNETLIAQLQQALAQVKKLSGMLPICSSCKKIRNDEGYWEQIEAYIRDHSEAEFSHGLCPECAERLYPGLKLYDPE